MPAAVSSGGCQYGNNSSQEGRLTNRSRVGLNVGVECINNAVSAGELALLDDRSFWDSRRGDGT